MRRETLLDPAGGGTTAFTLLLHLTGFGFQFNLYMCLCAEAPPVLSPDCPPVLPLYRIWTIVSLPGAALT
jgi:hypothetical protein